MGHYFFYPSIHVFTPPPNDPLGEQVETRPRALTSIRKEVLLLLTEMPKLREVGNICPARKPNLLFAATDGVSVMPVLLATCRVFSSGEGSVLSAGQALPGPLVQSQLAVAEPIWIV